MFIYNLGINIYGAAVKLASPFNTKAKQFAQGRKNWINKLKEKVSPTNENVWFHVASLGEFEQGRPVIEKYKQLYPNRKIILSFFSPSGYEIRKNYNIADYVCYLPLDTPKNAKQFIDIVNPKEVYFVKYDFWYNFLKEIHQRNIPLYIFSTIFRKEQVFFKKSGTKYREVLIFFTHLFVQDQQSVDLLKTIGIENVTIAGDTRFDRVCQITQNAADIPIAQSFVQNNNVIVAGSTWPPDENILIPTFEKLAPKYNLKLIIAPHEIHQSHIESIEKLIKCKCIRFSQATAQTAKNADILIIDNIGMLSSLYRYGQVAYIGGGFGVGIHNTLEAVSYSIPVVFGPNYKRFKEAVDLVDNGAGKTISTQEELQTAIDNYYSNSEMRIQAGNKAAEYVKQNLGATDIILQNRKSQ